MWCTLMTRKQENMTGKETLTELVTIGYIWEMGYKINQAYIFLKIIQHECGIKVYTLCDCETS